MRLGAWDCEILKNTISNKIYSKKVVPKDIGTDTSLMMNIQKRFLMKTLLLLVKIQRLI